MQDATRSERTSEDMIDRLCKKWNGPSTSHLSSTCGGYLEVKLLPMKEQSCRLKRGTGWAPQFAETNQRRLVSSKSSDHS